LDATAYPGNSGSPLYEEQTGKVIGVINSVFVKGTKETAIENPSGIIYVIPSQYVRALLDKYKGRLMRLSVIFTLSCLRYVLR